MSEPSCPAARPAHGLRQIQTEAVCTMPYATSAARSCSNTPEKGSGSRWTPLTSSKPFNRLPLPVSVSFSTTCARTCRQHLKNSAADDWDTWQHTDDGREDASNKVALIATARFCRQQLPTDVKDDSSRCLAHVEHPLQMGRHCNRQPLLSCRRSLPTTMGHSSKAARRQLICFTRSEDQQSIMAHNKTGQGSA